ncbi:MAG: TetR/AcrR family transcriptional regulator [Myxococcota bacterium]
MPDRPETTPRRTPRQRRSRATVEAVVEATAQMLREHGYDGATLERIAARAGASVGSIYQYFATKEGLLAAVMTRHLEELARCMAEAVAATADDDVRQQIRALVGGVVRAHRHDPDLHRVLTEEIPRVGVLDGHTQTLRTIERHVVDVLRTHPGAVRSGSVEVMATVVVAAVDAAIHTVILQRPELDPSVVEDEVTTLVERYLLA